MGCAHPMAQSVLPAVSKAAKMAKWTCSRSTLTDEKGAAPGVCCGWVGRSVKRSGSQWCTESVLSGTRVALGTLDCRSPLGKHAQQILRYGTTPLRRPAGRGRLMEVVHERCCGLDVHKK